MSDFFDSEIIQEELTEINNLQEKIYGSLFGFGMMSKEEKLEHIDILTNLLEIAVSETRSVSPLCVESPREFRPESLAPVLFRVNPPPPLRHRDML